MVRSRLLKLTEVKRSGCQAIIINKSLDNFTNSPINETSLPSCPPGFCSSDLTHPFTSPPLKGGEKENSPQLSLIKEGATLSVIADSEADPQSQDSELLKHGGQSDVQDDTNPLPQSLPRGRDVKRSSSLFTLHSSLKKRTAFTLAEVLITLGIIGIVAAIIMPSLINNYKKRETVNRLKSTYSIINNAMERAKADYGTDYSIWQRSSHDRYDFELLYSLYIKPYIKTVDVKKGTICRNYNCKKEYTTLSGQAMYQHDYGGSFILPNGALVHIIPYFCGVDLYSDIVYIDIDGPERGENRLGKDVFDYRLSIGHGETAKYIKNGIFATPCEGFTRDEILVKCSKDFDGASCAAKGAVSCCASLIMQDGWEIKDDYPW